VMIAAIAIAGEDQKEYETNKNNEKDENLL
jgi:hypothetical protein